MWRPAASGLLALLILTSCTAIASEKPRPITESRIEDRYGWGPSRKVPYLNKAGPNGELRT